MVGFFQVGLKEAHKWFQKKESVIAEENIDNNEYCTKDDTKKIFGLKFS